MNWAELNSSILMIKGYAGFSSINLRHFNEMSNSLTFDFLPPFNLYHSNDSYYLTFFFFPFDHTEISLALCV